MPRNPETSITPMQEYLSTFCLAGNRILHAQWDSAQQTVKQKWQTVHPDSDAADPMVIAVSRRRPK